MFRRVSAVQTASSIASTMVYASPTGFASVVNYPTPSSSDKQHAASCPRARIAGLDVNRLTYLPEAANAPANWNNPVANTIWDLEEAKKVEVNHKEPMDLPDKAAYYTVQAMRFAFDVLAGFKFGKVNESKFVNRCVFLETVAGVPGMVAGMLRHMTSLRRMERDHGWIHTLLEEAENERMHLLTFLEMKKPTFLFRCCVLITQGIFFNLFFIAYIISPKFCHRLVGYVEEEAVKTYTHLIESIDKGELPLFAAAKAPPLAINYWKLKPDAPFRDLVLAIRADEAGHRLVNHTFADMCANNLQHGTNPFVMHQAHIVNEAMKNAGAASAAAAAAKKDDAAPSATPSAESSAPKKESAEVQKE